MDPGPYSRISLTKLVLDPTSYFMLGDTVMFQLPVPQWPGASRLFLRA